MESLEGTAGSAHASAAADTPEYGGAVDTRGVHRADGNGGGAATDTDDEAACGATQMPTPPGPATDATVLLLGELLRLLMQLVAPANPHLRQLRRQRTHLGF